MYDITQLIKSKVQFNEIEHTYTLKGKQLNGITGVVNEYICPFKYNGISQAVLSAAAEYGHKVHSQVEMIVNGYGFAHPTPEVDAFFDKMQGTHFIAAEYLVSDNKDYASSIDIIDDELNLYDIKTTSTLDIDYVSWQLSIYAYLFEKQNPELKVKELFAAHLRNGKAKLIRVDRVPNEYVIGLLQAAKEHKEWSNPLKQVAIMQAKEVAKLVDFENAIASMETQLKEMKQKETEAKEKLLALMQNNNLRVWETDKIKLTVSSASTRSIIDSKRLKEEQPEIYKAYQKESPVKASLTIKMK